MRIGGFKLPEWADDAFERREPAATPAPPPSAAAGMPTLPSLHEIQRKIGESIERKLGPDSAGQIGWLQGKGPPTRDVTARFLQLNEAAAAGRNALPPDAKDYVYLNVGGLFTERYPGYMNANVERQKALGLDARRVPIDSDASVEANAKVVRDAILEAAKSGKRVVLLGHSKGGVDATAALALYPELAPHVRAVVAMQAPYAGSPIASDLVGCAPLRGKIETLVTGVFKGDPRALADITYDRRREFLAKHPYPPGIPTVSLATSSSSPLSLTAAAAHYVRSRYGEKSDGLVAAKDAEIPGSAVVRLDDMDHAAPAMEGLNKPCKYRPGDVTEALIALALTTPPV